MTLAARAFHTSTSPWSGVPPRLTSIESLNSSPPGGGGPELLTRPSPGRARVRVRGPRPPSTPACRRSPTRSSDGGSAWAPAGSAVTEEGRRRGDPLGRTTRDSSSTLRGAEPTAGSEADSLGDQAEHVGPTHGRAEEAHWSATRPSTRQPVAATVARRSRLLTRGTLVAKRERVLRRFRPANGMRRR